MINNIRKVRESKNLSIEEVASKTTVGMKPREIAKYENAEYVHLHIVTILARAMNVDRQELVEYWPEDED